MLKLNVRNYTVQISILDLRQEQFPLFLFMLITARLEIIKLL